MRRSPLALNALAAAVVALIVIAVVSRVSADFINVVSLAAIYGIVALSMHIIVGYTGQVSLGHAAFVGIGAFAAGYTLTEMAMPFLFAMAVAAITGGLGALVLGGVALRVTGLYLALVTIAFGEFAKETLFNIRSLTGGGAGQSAPRPSWFESGHQYAFFCIGILVLAMIFDWRLVSSRAGRAIQALRDDERVAASWGINVTGYKLAAFVMSGALAGVAGALFAAKEEIVSKEDFPLSLSITFLLMTVVGGIGSRWGVVAGGVFFALLPTLLDQAHENWHVIPFRWISATWEPAIGALLLLLTLTAFPGGIAQQTRFILAKLGLRDHDDDDHAVTTGGVGARP